MPSRQVRQAQRAINAFNERHKLERAKLRVDGDLGPVTKQAIRQARYDCGYAGEDINSDITPFFLWVLDHAKTARRKHLKEDRARIARGVSRRTARRAALRQRRASDALWGGSRYYTNRVIDIVGPRAPVTSRKRWELFGNPSSDHYMGKTRADAVDFGTVNSHRLKNELSIQLGGPTSLPDYGTFVTTHKGRRYRHQLIAGTHGTGPHLHYGCERVG